MASGVGVGAGVEDVWKHRRPSSGSLRILVISVFLMTVDTGQDHQVNELIVKDLHRSFDHSQLLHMGERLLFKVE